MIQNNRFIEWSILSTALGLAATLAAPWYELRGAFAAWRIVEWHTFWRGDDAFQLASVVASHYHVPVEYATLAMQDSLRALFIGGGVLGAWHSVAAIGLLIMGMQMRLRIGVSKPRVASESVALIVVNVSALALLAWLLALPSSLTPKVDFRALADIHSDTLIWSTFTILPVAPILSFVALGIQLVLLAVWFKRKID